MTKVLQFSGGRDSLACLYLLEPQWDDLTVVWCNSGAAFPETIAQMQKIRDEVPNFLEVKSAQTIEHNGYPVDLLPISSTVVGQQIEGSRPFKYQSRYDCCAAALWLPMHRTMLELRADFVIRGQKLADRRKSPIRSGDVIEGIRYEFPLEDWSDERVLEYLKRRGVELPANYQYMNTGLDCWNCTAYLDENVGKFDYMRERHPDRYRQVRSVLIELAAVIKDDLRPLKEISAKALSAEIATS